MCWTDLIVGIFLGAGLGIVAAGMVVSAKRKGAEGRSTEIPINYNVIDGIEEVPDELATLPEPETYFDKYPHS